MQVIKNKDKSYKRIRNQIIAGVSSGIMVSMMLIGGTNTVYAETMNKTIPFYSTKKSLDHKASEVKNLENKNGKKNVKKGWRKNNI